MKCADCKKVLTHKSKRCKECDEIFRHHPERGIKRNVTRVCAVCGKDIEGRTSEITRAVCYPCKQARQKITHKERYERLKKLKVDKASL